MVGEDVPDLASTKQAAVSLARSSARPTSCPSDFGNLLECASPRGLAGTGPADRGLQRVTFIGAALGPMAVACAGESSTWTVARCRRESSQDRLAQLRFCETYEFAMDRMPSAPSAQIPLR
jgi:hypothetical protein